MNSNFNSSSCCSPSNARTDPHAVRGIRVLAPGFASPLLAAFFPEFTPGAGVASTAQPQPASVPRSGPSSPSAAAISSTPAAVATQAHAGQPARIPMNVAEFADRYEVHAALPGFRLEQVDVTFNDNVLSLQANPSAPDANPGVSADVNWLRREIPTGAFSRSLAFREAINPDLVSATMDSGLLTVTLAKHVLAQPRRISIQRPNSVSSQPTPSQHAAQVAGSAAAAN